jgi:hypothetical protein
LSLCFVSMYHLRSFLGRDLVVRMDGFVYKVFWKVILSETRFSVFMGFIDLFGRKLFSLYFFFQKGT